MQFHFERLGVIQTIYTHQRVKSIVLVQVCTTYTHNSYLLIYRMMLRAVRFPTINDLGRVGARTLSIK